MDSNGEVKKIGFRQYLTGHFSLRPSDYLSEEELGLVFDGFVLAFVNCILVAQDKRLMKMLVVKRITEPWANWWLPGAKMVPGESFEETAVRFLKRQLNLATEDRSRFQYLGTYAFVWEKRGIPPTGHGCHILSTILVLKIDKEEMKAIKILGDEYSAFEWVRPEIIVIQAGLHKGLAGCVRDLIEFFGITKSGRE